jgi:hypothetical protein
LLRDGRWEAVRARLLALDPHAAEWIDAPLIGDWQPAERHFAIMRALLAEVGVEGIRQYGRRRLEESLRIGPVAPILRSWLRSYSGAPQAFLRVHPHMWQAITRNMGRMALLHHAPNEMVFRIAGAPESLRRAEAWHRYLEGYSEGLLAVGGYRGQATLQPATDAADALDGTIRWES